MVECSLRLLYIERLKVRRHVSIHLKDSITKSALERKQKNDHFNERLRGRNKGKGRKDLILHLENSISLGKVGTITHQNMDI